MRRFISCFLAFIIMISASPWSLTAVGDEPTDNERMNLFKTAGKRYGIPWYYLAAVDQYEHSLRNSRNDLPDSDGPIGILVPSQIWRGLANLNPTDTDARSIAFFSGIGKDGNGDGYADPKDGQDILASIALQLNQSGTSEEDIRIALWKYYRRDKAVGIVMGNARLFKKYGTIELNDKAFPVPITSTYSYRSTWGVARGWGGRRSHEGTDIFAGYGVPVRATSYGVIEIKGWNRFGGWRLGIRDINNTYHYFAHLNSFAKNLRIGQIVEPGMIIGSVGATGYGPPGTSGKFPPHLHFGMYKDNGFTEWSFDPYYQLRQWEQTERKKRNNG